MPGLAAVSDTTSSSKWTTALIMSLIAAVGMIGTTLSTRDFSGGGGSGRCVYYAAFVIGSSYGIPVVTGVVKVASHDGAQWDLSAPGRGSSGNPIVGMMEYSVRGDTLVAFSNSPPIVGTGDTDVYASGFEPCLFLVADTAHSEFVGLPVPRMRS